MCSDLKTESLLTCLHRTTDEAQSNVLHALAVLTLRSSLSSAMTACRTSPNPCRPDTNVL